MVTKYASPSKAPSNVRALTSRIAMTKYGKRAVNQMICIKHNIMD